MINFRNACIVVLTLAVPLQAHAAPAKCLSRAELKTGIAYVMPALVKGVVAKCTTLIPADSYLARDGNALIARYATESQGSEDDVRALFSRLGPEMGLNGADAKSTATLVESLVTVGIQSAIKPETCTDISTAMALLDPLPASNMNGLVEFVLLKVDEGNARKQAKLADANQTDAPKSKRTDKPFLCETQARLNPAQ